MGEAFMPAKRNDKGSILILIVLLVALLAFIPVGTSLLETSRKQVKLQANSYAQATNVARAGLTDAEAWFRMQTVQPVGSTKLGMAYPDAAFYPRGTSGSPKDTDDETIGLVRTFQLGESTNLFARYEVQRQTVNNVVYSTSTNGHAVHDITASRTPPPAQNGDGLIWYIESVGYVYQQKSAAVAYNQSPNVIVGRARVSSELRRMGLVDFDAAAAIVNRGNISVGANCRLMGGNGAYGVVSNSGSGNPANVTGSLGVATTTGTAISIPNIFGLQGYDIRMLADYAVTTANDLPTNYPSTGLVYVDGNAVFDDTHPLTGGGVLIVNGDLTVQSTSNALFSGVIFVQGNASINGPALISGSVFVGGTLTLTGTTDVAQVEYDSQTLNTVRQNVGQYRQNHSAYHVFSALDAKLN